MFKGEMKFLVPFYAALCLGSATFMFVMMFAGGLAALAAIFIPLFIVMGVLAATIEHH
jgi:hypothetical protein